MTALNKQALIAKIKKQTESFDTVVLKEDEANALLDELETSQKYAKDRDAENEDLMLTVGRLRMEKEAAEKRIAEHNFENRLLANADRDIKALRQRIAELEARTVTLPPKEHDNGTDSQIDINAGFANRMWQKCYDAIHAAGIGVKGE